MVVNPRVPAALRSVVNDQTKLLASGIAGYVPDPRRRRADPQSLRVYLVDAGRVQWGQRGPTRVAAL